MRDLAMHFRGLAKIQEATAPNMIGYRIVGTSLLLTGNIVEGRLHLDRALALYDPAEHRSLATRFGQDVRVGALSWRSMALWLLGYPAAALVDADHALKDAREVGQGYHVVVCAVLGIVAIFLLWRLRNSERVGR